MSKKRAQSFLELITSYENVKKDVKIQLGNMVYPSTDMIVKNKFTNILTKMFKSGVKSLDFNDGPGAAKTINGFVNNATNGLIESIVEPAMFNSQTRLIQPLSSKSIFKSSCLSCPFMCTVMVAYVWLLINPYVNGVTLREQNQP